MPWSKPYFAQYIPGIVEPLNEIRYCSPLVEVKQKNVYNKKSNGYQGFIVQCSNKQKQTVQRLSKKFFKVLKSIDKLCKLKVALNKPNRKWKYERQIASDLIDKALCYICTASIFSIRDLIRNEQNTLFNLMIPSKDYAQLKFDFQLEFDHNGNVVPQPTFEEYTVHIMSLYDSIRKTIVSEKVVEEFLFDVVAVARDELGKRDGY